MGSEMCIRDRIYCLECNLSVFNGTVKQQLTKDFAVCPRSSFSNCAKAQERKQRAHRCIHARPFRPEPRRRCHHSCCAAAAVLLLLCCCFCCSTIRDASRSTIRTADPQCIICRESRKNVSLRGSISFNWRSGLTRGAGTKNSSSASPPPLLLCCCCCAAAAVLLLLLFHDPRRIAEHDPQC